jgi:hypothetical protein
LIIRVTVSLCFYRFLMDVFTETSRQDQIDLSVVWRTLLIIRMQEEVSLLDTRFERIVSLPDNMKRSNQRDGSRRLRIYPPVIDGNSSARGCYRFIGYLIPYSYKQSSSCFILLSVISCLTSSMLPQASTLLKAGLLTAGLLYSDAKLNLIEAFQGIAALKKIERTYVKFSCFSQRTCFDSRCHCFEIQFASTKLDRQELSLVRKTRHIPLPWRLL